MEIFAREQWQASREGMGLLPHNGKERGSWITGDPIRQWFFTEGNSASRGDTPGDIFHGHNWGKVANYM